MVAETIIFVCVAGIAIIEVSNFISKNSLNKPARLSIILLCLGLIAYFNIQQGNISGNESTKENADSLENEVKILHAQIDTLSNNINKKSDSNRNNEVITEKQKDTLVSIEKNNIILDTKSRVLTDPLKSEFQKDVRHYFSKYNLPAGSPIDIICRAGDDNAYDFAEELNAYLKSSGYQVNPIVNRMELRSKKMTSLDMNLKNNHVEINIGSTDISSTNPIVLQ